MPFKTATGKLLYRIGDVIISTNSDNPSKTYGGSWQLLCPGKTLVCIDTNDSDFNTVKKVGGEKRNALTLAEIPSHNHSASSGYISNDHSHYLSLGTSSAGNHKHGLRGYYNVALATGSSARSVPSTVLFSNDPLTENSSVEYNGIHSHSISGSTGGVSSNHTHSITVGSTGNGYAHNNLQPYIVVYMWVRVS